MQTAAKHSTWSEIRSLGVFGRAWATGIILFSLARALLAWPTLGRYGVNPWLFLALDVITAPPYGISQAVAIKILRDEHRPARDAAGWSGIVIATFLAPYVYIFWASGSMPFMAYAMVTLWMAVFGAFAAWRFVREVKAPEV